MTNRDIVIRFIERNAGQCDDCVSEGTGVRPRQQVNQICRKLACDGAVDRPVTMCAACRGKKICNTRRR